MAATRNTYLSFNMMTISNEPFQPVVWKSCL